MDTFDNLSEALAGFGLTLSERTRLTFGAPVLAALKQVEAGKGKVFVACSQGANIMQLEAKLSEDARKVARFIDATEYSYAQVRPHVLLPADEQVLKTKDTFRECASEQGKDYCPEMVVVPAGSFMMGSPPTEMDPTARPLAPPQGRLSPACRPGRSGRRRVGMTESVP